MYKPFIRNHQYNFMKKQADLLQNTLRTNADLKVLESVKYSVQSKIVDLFPDVPASEKAMLGSISTVEKAEDFQAYLRQFVPYVSEFPAITEKQIQKLFPKNKKLKVPDLSTIDYRYITYLSWVDISTNKLFLVYHQNGQFIGIEGKYTLTSKKSFCFLCNRFEELVLFSAVSKTRPAKSSPDYYKSVGNYLCMDSQACNKNITDTLALEKFIAAVVG
ncbi:elongation factor G-binding protein [Paenibacillus marchantiophytorum]|uniref:Elongation factor G-binding protein n=1 Tax=Paenibacillus marchantiophytorum TaxID=1619310 RepID=A0ABQ1F6A6_9BACL|nr:FusB/FusC family EF-G-binding protein [Paenibacillus marchantiophytorum]GFZ99969.1 elongation factor G-binding protein [Paenibacillus marchantiophytorum]